MRFAARSRAPASPTPDLRRPWTALARVAWPIAIAVLTIPAAHAEKADRDKPINVEADRMQYDDLKQINVFTGNVVLTKGTIVIRGDRVVVRQDPEGFQYGTAYGSPSKLATFRQKRDGIDEYVEGSAVQLDYNGKTEIFTLTQQASMRKLIKERVTDEAHGNVITYNSLTEFYTVDGAGQSASSSSPGNGRVRVVIQPKTEPGSGAAVSAPPPAPVTIRPDPRLSDPADGNNGTSR